MALSYLSYRKRFNFPIAVYFESNFCIIKTSLASSKFVLKKNCFFLINSNNFLIHKKYIRSFFTLFWMQVKGSSQGFRTTLYVKGKGLRLQLKTRKGHLCIYLKLGYSHKIFLHLPTNCWAKTFGRRRTIRFYSLNYILLRNLVLKIRSFYPMGLYKIRGFYIEKEKIQIIEGKSRLGSGGGLYG